MPEPHNVVPGTVLAGKYRVERVLGAGGMGFVVAAQHLELQQLVAMKFLHRGMLENAEAVARFLREARAAARIRSEHVARVIDVGRLEDGAPYTVMEFLQGRDLAGLLEQGPVPVQDAVEYVLQACHAVAEAHAAGIVHRDLKPSNLFLTERSDGVFIVKVLDFGISKLMAVEPFEPQLTSTQSAMGSPLYMSPEQMRSSRDVDLRADIWSLGVILYELMSGAPPFNGGSLHELVTALALSTPASLHALRPEVSPQLEAVVMRCLQKDPSARFQSVGDLAQELLPFAPQHSQFMVERVARLSRSSRPPGSGAHGSFGPAAAGGASSESLRPGAATGAPWSSTRRSLSPLRRPRVLAAGAVVALALAVAGAFALHRAATGPAPSVSASGGELSVPVSAPLSDRPAAPPSSELATASSPPLGASAPASSLPTNAALAKPTLAKNTTNRRPLSGSGAPSAAPSSAPPPSVRRRTLDIELK